jgi:hypothetical protein
MRRFFTATAERSYPNVLRNRQDSNEDFYSNQVLKNGR